jgi:lysophospholipase L1-like esterase
MNPVVRFLAAGDCFYAGTALLAATVVASECLHHAWVRRTRNLAALLALIMIVLACPPFPWSADILFLAIFTLWCIAYSNVQLATRFHKPRTLTAVVLISQLVWLSAEELSHRALPVISGMPEDHVLVIGDSLSSGIDSRTRSWPLLMQESTGIKVTNLALAGAVTADARAMAERITPTDHVLIIEIGGNDLLSGIPARTFGNNLQAILSKASAPGRTVVMFELPPVLPQYTEYGQIQRRLAKQYKVFLIPKHFLIEIIGTPGATTDGLHLSASGAHQMAMLVTRVLAPVLRRPPPHAPVK